MNHLCFLAVFSLRPSHPISQVGYKAETYFKNLILTEPFHNLYFYCFIISIWNIYFFIGA